MYKLVNNFAGNKVYEPIRKREEIPKESLFAKEGTNFQVKDIS
jgi:hypothetical protein